MYTVDLSSIFMHLHTQAPLFYKDTVCTNISVHTLHYF